MGNDKVFLTYNQQMRKLRNDKKSSVKAHHMDFLVSLPKDEIEYNKFDK